MYRIGEALPVAVVVFTFATGCEFHEHDYGEISSAEVESLRREVSRLDGQVAYLNGRVDSLQGTTFVLGFFLFLVVGVGIAGVIIAVYYVSDPQHAHRHRPCYVINDRGSQLMWFEREARPVHFLQDVGGASGVGRVQGKATRKGDTHGRAEQ